MIIGLTGGSGTGKSSACRFFEDKGFVTVDLDAVARKVCQKGEPCLKEIAEAFGSDILDGSGNLKRKELGSIVFNDSGKLEVLNSVTHKYIIEETEKIISDNKGRNIVLDAPLLFESGLDKYCNFTICVLSRTAERIRRITERDGITKAQAEARIKSQHDDEYYISRCDAAVYNNSDLNSMMRELEDVTGGQNGE